MVEPRAPGPAAWVMGLSALALAAGCSGERAVEAHAAVFDCAEGDRFAAGGPAPELDGLVFGAVTDVADQPLPLGEVWVEPADLRDPVNNAACYARGRHVTLARPMLDGSFVAGAPVGPVQLVASAPGYLPQRISVDLAPGDPFELRFRLRAARPRVVAHRGGRSSAPENTLAAFTKSSLLGVSQLELDVRATKDDQLVVLHDRDLDRTTNGKGLVREHRLAELRGLDAGRWFDASFADEPVPTLEETLALAARRGQHLIVEAKDDPAGAEFLVDALLAMVERTGTAPLVTMSSSVRKMVKRCVLLARVPCAFIAHGPATGLERLEETVKMGAQLLMLEHRLVDAEVVARAHAEGLLLYTWTANGHRDWEAALASAADGIVTDRPGDLIDYLDEIAHRAAADARR